MELASQIHSRCPRRRLYDLGWSLATASVLNSCIEEWLSSIPQTTGIVLRDLTQVTLQRANAAVDLRVSIGLTRSATVNVPCTCMRMNIYCYVFTFTLMLSCWNCHNFNRQSRSSFRFTSRAPRRIPLPRTSSKAPRPRSPSGGGGSSGSSHRRSPLPLPLHKQRYGNRRNNAPLLLRSRVRLTRLPSSRLKGGRGRSRLPRASARQHRSQGRRAATTRPLY